VFTTTPPNVNYCEVISNFEFYFFKSWERTVQIRPRTRTPELPVLIAVLQAEKKFTYTLHNYYFDTKHYRLKAIKSIHKN